MKKTHTYFELYHTKNQLLKMQTEGKSIDDMKNYLYDLGYSKKGANEVIAITGRDVAKAYESYIEEAVQYQWNRLESIVTECLKNNNYKDALRAIDLQSKISKLYEVNVVNNTQINTEGIEINFN